MPKNKLTIARKTKFAWREFWHDIIGDLPGSYLREFCLT